MNKSHISSLIRWLELKAAKRRLTISLITNWGKEINELLKPFPPADVIEVNWSNEATVYIKTNKNELIRLSDHQSTRRIKYDLDIDLWTGKPRERKEIKNEKPIIN